MNASMLAATPAGASQEMAIGVAYAGQRAGVVFPRTEREAAIIRQMPIAARPLAVDMVGVATADGAIERVLPEAVAGRDACGGRHKATSLSQIASHSILIATFSRSRRTISRGLASEQSSAARGTIGASSSSASILSVVLPYRDMVGYPTVKVWLSWSRSSFWPVSRMPWSSM